jgi:predicted transcriptional regulator
MQTTQKSSNSDLAAHRFDQQHPHEDVHTFEPSFRILKRLFAIMLTENGKNRTALAQQANLNYCRLSRHFDWLESKNLARLIVKDGRVQVILTESGVLFAVALVGRTE